LATGAVTLALFARIRRPPADVRQGGVASALLLFAYAAPFSYAYVRMDAGMGALVLFGSVQVTMIGWGLVGGERPAVGEWLGAAIAAAGLGALTLPGASRPDLGSFLLMVVAGVAWGAYSIRGMRTRDALAATAGNFLLSAPLAVALAGAQWLASLPAAFHVELGGALLATASGTVASGVAYTFWYRALPSLGALPAALLQLTVPVIAGLGAVVLLSEEPGVRLFSAGGAVLGGVAVALVARARARS
jgi:drug/metabolite transporter (DMT)-like permease